MAVYVRALLEDMVHDKGDPTTRIDLLQSVNRLLDTKQLTPEHVRLMKLHLHGYKASELWFLNRNIDTMLTQAYALIEEQSGYTDEVLLQRGVNLFPAYGKILPALREQAFIIGRDLNGNLE